MTTLSGWLTAVRERLAHLFRPGRLRHELEEEMCFHLDQRCLHRSLLIRQPVSESMASSAPTERQIP